MKAITQVYNIKAPIEAVSQALTNPDIIAKWSRELAFMDDNPGTHFELWHGNIHGTNKEIENPPTGTKKLVQEWYGGDWPEASLVTFTLTPVGQETRIDLFHENIPDNEADDIADGWQRYYLGQIKSFLEGKPRWANLPQD